MTWTTAKLRAYAYVKSMHPRSVGHIPHGMFIVFCLAVFGPMAGALAAVAVYGYQVAEGIRLIVRSIMTGVPDGDGKVELAGVDYLGIKIGFMIGIGIWAVVRVLWFIGVQIWGWVT